MWQFLWQSAHWLTTCVHVVADAYAKEHHQHTYLHPFIWIVMRLGTPECVWWQGSVLVHTQTVWKHFKYAQLQYPKWSRLWKLHLYSFVKFFYIQNFMEVDMYYKWLMVQSITLLIHNAVWLIFQPCVFLQKNLLLCFQTFIRKFQSKYGHFLSFYKAVKLNGEKRAVWGSKSVRKGSRLGVGMRKRRKEKRKGRLERARQH